MDNETELPPTLEIIRALIGRILVLEGSLRNTQELILSQQALHHTAQEQIAEMTQIVTEFPTFMAQFASFMQVVVKREEQTEKRFNELHLELEAAKFSRDLHDEAKRHTS